MVDTVGGPCLGCFGDIGGTQDVEVGVEVGVRL